MYNQIFPTKLNDTVIERHVYTGQLGEGFIDIEYRISGQKLEVKFDHHGPEQRNIVNEWKEIKEKTIPAVTDPDTTEITEPEKKEKNPIRLILDGTHSWDKEKGIKENG